MNTSIITESISDKLSKHKLKRIRNQEDFREVNQSTFNNLTRREIEVISNITIGMSSQEIAECLFISKHTVEQHRKNINRKLGIHSFSELFQYALAFDLI